MSIRDRRLAAVLVIVASGVVLLSVATMAAEAPGYVRWDHAGVLIAAAVAFASGGAAYLYGTRKAPAAWTPQEICTAYYLATAAFAPPLEFGDRS